MVRRPDWPARLAEQLEGARRRPFCFGAHDCYLFAADVVLAMTGHDTAAELRGAYANERSALRKIAAHGSFRASIEHYYGPPSAGLPARGDVVLARRNGRESLGVCIDHRFAGPGALGLEYGRVDEAICFWKI